MKTSISNSHLPEWQQGENCKMDYILRLQEMEKWLKKNKQEIMEARNENKTIIEEQNVGFIDL